MLEQIDFYSLKQITTSETGKIEAQVELNVQHPVFKGHFPQNPVTPGVCLIQITKEMIEKSINRTTDLLESSQVKFLAVVDPTIDSILKIVIESKELDGLIFSNATISSGEKIFFKFKGIFKRNND